MKAAVAAAQSAFPAWRDTSIMSRQQVMFKLQHLIKEKTVGASLLLPVSAERTVITSLLTSSLYVSARTILHLCHRKNWLLVSLRNKGKLWLMLREMYFVAFVC